MNLGVFFGIAALMFAVELPDKTMIATIVMSSRARPWAVVAGASCAFVVQMAIAVAAGGLLTLLPGRARDGVVAALFLGGAAYLLWPRGPRADEEARDAARVRPGSTLRDAATAFGVIFVAEFGDLSQIQAANFEARTREPLEVFLAASLALIAVTCLGAFGGRALQRVLPLAWIRRGGGVIFAGLGVYTLVTLVTS